MFFDLFILRLGLIDTSEKLPYEHPRLPYPICRTYCTGARRRLRVNANESAQNQLMIGLPTFRMKLMLSLLLLCWYVSAQSFWNHRKLTRHGFQAKKAAKKARKRVKNAPVEEPTPRPPTPPLLEDMQ